MDKKGLYNAALLKIKQRRINALTDNVPSRLEIDAVYNDVLAYMLEQGLWNFAQRTISLEPSVDIETEFGFRNAFEVPDDFVRLISISSNPYLWPPMVAGQYWFEGGVWEADCNPLFVSYVSDDTSFGSDLSKWSTTYADAVAFEIAVRVAPQLTNMSATEFDLLQKNALKALRRSRTLDSLNQANQEPPPGKLTMSRRNYRNRTLWER